MERPCCHPLTSSFKPSGRFGWLSGE
uniref:Uncharacterized protein n=1 Tax=Echinococcus granulosus TaxID=6210 RepID=A0A068WSL3_ECHGR|nr:hypothetical protein EgrG_001090500 [Echinococcus granulosus]